MTPENFLLDTAFADLSPITVIDVGAMGTGTEEPYANLVARKRARVIGFEPDQEECRKLNETVGPPHLYLPYFIGDGQPATYYQTNYTMTGSLYRPNRKVLDMFVNLGELVQLVQEHPVQTTRLDDIPVIDDADFIKLDVQGGELNVLRHGSVALQAALVVQVEVEFLELYEGQPMFADVDKFLRANGFQFHTFPGFGQRCFRPIVINNDPNIGIRQHIWSDAIYVKDWLGLDKLSIEKLKKYAVLSQEICDSMDLCSAILMHLDARCGTTYTQDYLAWCARGPA